VFYSASLLEIVTSQEISVIDRGRSRLRRIGREVYRVGWDSRDLRASLLEESAYSVQPWARLMSQNRPGERAR
jgi:hypothetical protein